LAQEIGGLIVNVSQVYSNRGSGKNKHSYNKLATTVDWIHAKTYIIIDASLMQHGLESRVIITGSAVP